MAVIKPFKALRPEKEIAPKVASVPYDVVNREEAKQLVADNKLSFLRIGRAEATLDDSVNRSEEHTSELQSHWYISYAVFCLKKKKKTKNTIEYV